MKFLLVFGSLRKYSKRGYNFNRFKNYGEQLFIRELELPGYEMYDLNFYPAICQGEGVIKCELHSVTDEVFNAINKMEIGAGYKSKTLQLDNDINATIYLMDKSKLSKFPRVKSGDWN